MRICQKKWLLTCFQYGSSMAFLLTPYNQIIQFKPFDRRLGVYQYNFMYFIYGNPFSLTKRFFLCKKFKNQQFWMRWGVWVFVNTSSFLFTSFVCNIYDFNMVNGVAWIIFFLVFCFAKTIDTLNVAMINANRHCNSFCMRFDLQPVSIHLQF